MAFIALFLIFRLILKLTDVLLNTLFCVFVLLYFYSIYSPASKDRFWLFCMENIARAISISNTVVAVVTDEQSLPLEQATIVVVSTCSSRR